MFRQSRRQDATSDIAARYLTMQRHARPHADDIDNDDLRYVMNNDMLMDALRLPRGSSMQASPVKSAMQDREYSHKMIEGQGGLGKERSSRFGNSVRIEGYTKKLSKQVDFKEKRDKARITKQSKYEDSNNDQKLMLSRLLRNEALNELVEIPIEELKAEIDRKNKLKFRLNEQKLLLKKLDIASRDEMSIELTAKNIDTLENELNETPSSPARFHPRPEIEINDEISPLVKLKKNINKDFKQNCKLLLHQVREHKRSDIKKLKNRNSMEEYDISYKR